MAKNTNPPNPAGPTEQAGPPQGYKHEHTPSRVSGSVCRPVHQKMRADLVSAQLQFTGQR